MISVLMLSSILLSSCFSSSDNPFPEVTQPKQETTSLSNPSDPIEPTALISGSDPIVLKVAAPISSDTANYLAKLYMAKKGDLLGEGVNGSNVSLDILNSYTPGFSVEILQTPSTGATLDTMAQWKANEFVPDIIYTDALSSLQSSGDILPLSDYMASDSLYLPGNIDPSMLNACSLNGELYGIPYSASAQVMFLNMDVLAEAGIDSVPFNLDLEMFLSISDAVRKTSSGDTPMEELHLAFYKAGELLPFLPSSYSSTSGWFTYNGSTLDISSPAFEKTVEFLRSYVDEGFSLESLSAEDQTKSFASLDPRLSNRVAMWVGSTEEISLWTTNTAYKLSIAQIPAETSETESKLALTVYPLCISSETKNAQLASDFASFIALDEDAVLLSARLEQTEGYLPVISSSSVWNAVLTQQTFGAELLQLKSKMDTAYFNPISNHASDYLLIEQILNEYGGQLLDIDSDYLTVIPLLSSVHLTA